MFSRFANALYSAVDALAPPLPLQEDFVWHWKSVTKFYTSQNATKKLPIEMTSIPGHLFEMLTILEQEENEIEDSTIGACIEYIMSHKLLDTMCVLGIADAPPGMKRYMLVFATRFLKVVKQFLIPHVSIYIPITKFLKLCGEVQAAPTEKEEMDLLEVICDRISENPCLTGCFMGAYNDSESLNSSHHGQEKGNKLQHMNESCTKSKSDDDGSHTLISSLLKLFFSPDKSISDRASVCLIKCCSLANDSAAFKVIKNSALDLILCNYLGKLYNMIPKTMKSREMEESADYIGDKDLHDERRLSPSQRKFLCYLQHLKMVDTIISESHAVISDLISCTFRAEFLNKVIYSDLVESESSENNLFVTLVLTSSIRAISSTNIMSSFELFMLGDKQNFDISGHASHIAKDLLIERCRNTEKNLALSMATLQLFEEILHRPSQFMLQNLIIDCVISRSYFDHTAADDWLSFSDDDSSKLLGDDSPLSSSPANKTFAPPYIHRILDAFLSLVPDDMKSAETEEDSGYETYIKEAHCRFMKCLVQCETFDWPAEPLTKEEYHLGTEDDSSSGSQPEADSSYVYFYEGPFLSMLFDKVEHMLELPYDVNLQVTSIISTLALFPHPNLHEYLLNPLIPLTPGVRSLFSVLLKIIEELQEKVKNIKSFSQKLRLTRKSLLSDDPCEAFDETSTFEVLIVIEEFCKELAAIVFVKYNAVS